MQNSLQGIANKATKQPKYRFRNLSILLSEENLIWSMRKMNKKAAPGVDKVDYQEYQENLEENIKDLVTRLKRGSYKAKLVRRKNIPKGKGKSRPLGIPVMEDKLLQTAVAQILQTIWESDFLDVSYGYRPKLGSKDAVKHLARRLRFERYHYVVEADIKGYFDSIDHQWLVRMLEQRIDDRRFIRLIRKWLRAQILEEDGKILDPRTGTPQGGVISAVLANIYLHYALDLWFEREYKKGCRGKAELVRYADDFVAAFESKKEAEKFYEELKERLKKFGLELNPEKTRVILFSRSKKEESETFDFLGFEYRWGKSLKGKDKVGLRTSRNKLRASVANFAKWIKKNRHIKKSKLLKTLKAKYRGYWNYYGVIGNYESLQQFHYQTQKLLYKWLNRRSQKKSMSWKSFNQMMWHLKDVRPRITEQWSSAPAYG
ncbi:MAG: group II intron reverse transcriptase/maturase [bacterium]|nr:group II intron reverse transcriptase/maturase [bacterium]